MGTSGGDVPVVVEDRNDITGYTNLRHSDGSVGGRVSLYAQREENGSIRAQLELRFEDQSSLVTIAELGLADEGHETGRSWVLVEMEPRQSLSEPLRFSIHIPGKPANTGDDTRDTEAAIAIIRAARETIPTVRKGCVNTHGCDYPVCDVATDGGVWKLANDRCLAKLVSLAALPLHSSDSGT
jgi:hypothetical protein